MGYGNTGQFWAEFIPSLILEIMVYKLVQF